MAIYEDIRRINCENDAGRSVVIIEQRKWASFAQGKSRTPVFDYITEDGEIANKLDDENFLLLMTAEVFHRA